MRGRAAWRAQLTGTAILLAWAAVPVQANTLTPAPTLAPGEVQVRAGDHGDFTRVVYVLPKGITYRSARLGELLVLTFPGAGQIPGVSPTPANVLSVTGGHDEAAIGVPAGIHAHVWRLDQRVIVDVFASHGDAPPAAPAIPAARPHVASAAAEPRQP